MSAGRDSNENVNKEQVGSGTRDDVMARRIETGENENKVKVSSLST